MNRTSSRALGVLAFSGLFWLVLVRTGIQCGALYVTIWVGQVTYTSSHGRVRKAIFLRVTMTRPYRKSNPCQTLAAPR